MKKITLSVLASVMIAGACFSQNKFPATGSAGIGTTTPDASSLLEIKSVTKGFLPPRMTKAQRDAIVAPARGLVIYQINNTPDLYFYDGQVWTAVSGKTNRFLSNLIAPTAVNTDLLPGLNNNISLGNNGLRWKNVNLYNLNFADGSIQTTAALPYTAGTSINISGRIISNTSPDKIVALNAGTGISVSGTYPNFNISSTVTPGANTALSNLAATSINADLIPVTDNSINFGDGTKRWRNVYLNALNFIDGSLQTTAFNPYTSGIGINISGNTITNVAPDQTVALTAGPGIFVNGTYPNFNISSTVTPGANTALSNLAAVTAVNSDLIPAADASINLGDVIKHWRNIYLNALNFSDGSLQTTAFNPYTSGAGINISGNTITNAAPDQTVALSAGTGISVSGTYPNFNISSAVTPGANTALSNLAAVTSVNSDLIPVTDNSINFGDGTKRWRNVYLNALNFIDGSLQTTAFNPYTSGIGINISGNTITNVSPDKIVVLNAGTGISINGTYPNFTISSTGSSNVMPLVKAVQELSAKNDSLQNVNQQMQSSLSDVLSQLSDIKKQLTKLKTNQEACCSKSSINQKIITANQQSVNSKDFAKLEQNIPNPFNNTCTINYYIPAGFHTAQLLITDVSGHTLKTYSFATSGYGKQIIKGNELSQGMYQYSLLIDGKLIDTKKMVLSK